MPAKPVTIIILTWNGIEYTKRCIASLRQHTDYPRYELCVVDNGSTDGTIEYLEALKGITLIKNDKNLGFARGNNLAIEAARSDSDIVLLNNDTEVPHDEDEWLARLHATAYSADDIGIVGCRLRRPNGMLQHAGAYMPPGAFWGQQTGSEEMDINQYPFVRDVEAVVFACVYIKRAVVNEIGGLCEDYFAYFEDSDYCLRARDAGFRTVCSGDVTIIHLENVSTRENKVSHSQLFRSSQSTFKKKWATRIDSRYDTRVVWHSTVSRPHGYAMTSKDLLLSLDRDNVEVTYRYLYGRGTVFPVNEPEQTDYYLVNLMKQRPIPRNVPHVVYGQGDAFAANKGPYKIGYTMLEVTGIPEEWVRQANMMDELWVPTEFNRQTFTESGVTRPIHVLPLGVDINYFNPLVNAYPVTEDYKFLTVFEWGERKAPEMLIKAFNDTFRADEPVVLLCKANCTDPSVDVPAIIASLDLSEEGGRIQFIMNKYAPHYQLGSLYRSADCFVLTSRGEGWGMPILEAMACGLPSISTYWSAPTAFMTEANSYPLQVKQLINAVAKCPYYAGFKWADPDEEHLRYLLRYVFEHQDEAAAKGARAAADVTAKWTIEHAADGIKRRLAEVAEERGVAATPVHSAPAARAHPPRVALDVSRAIGEQITGIGRYARSLVRSLALAPPANLEFVLLPGFASFVHPEYGSRWGFDEVLSESMMMYRGPLPAFGSRDTIVPDIDLIHSTGNAAPATNSAPLLMTVYDLSFITHPQFHTDETIALCTRNLDQAVQLGAHFVAISENTRQDLLSHCRLRDDQVSVVPCAYDGEVFSPASADSIAAVRRKYHLPDRYYLFLASLEPRKNLATVLKAVTARELPYPVVVAGAKGWKNDALERAISAAGPRVMHIGYITEGDLPALYSGATALVYPSRYEGFGLPVLEAMACGTAAITTRVASLPEVAGEAALLLEDPDDAGALADAMLSLAQDEELRARCEKAGLTQATQFSLKVMNTRLTALYHRLLEE